MKTRNLVWTLSLVLITGVSYYLVRNGKYYLGHGPFRCEVNDALGSSNLVCFEDGRELLSVMREPGKATGKMYYISGPESGSGLTITDNDGDRYWNSITYDGYDASKQWVRYSKDLNSDGQIDFYSDIKMKKSYVWLDGKWTLTNLLGKDENGIGVYTVVRDGKNYRINPFKLPLEFLEVPRVILPINVDP